MNIDQVMKIHDPNLISANIEAGLVKLEKTNDTEEIQQKKKLKQKL